MKCLEGNKDDKCPRNDGKIVSRELCEGCKYRGYMWRFSSSFQVDCYYEQGGSDD